MDLESEIKLVKSRVELARFVGLLKIDLEANPDDWENCTLADFLDALSAWINDMDGYCANVGKFEPENPTWRDLAEMLLAAKTYE